MRTKKWAKPELAVCPFYIKDATLKKGKWHDEFERRQPLYLELGCGKGGFISQISSRKEDVNFLAVDLSSDMLGISKRKIEMAFEEKGRKIDNVRLTWQNIERIDNMLSKVDTVDRIYINFCNPWFKPMQYKKRLTHTRQLMKYREFLAEDGEIRFKTDDDELFCHSKKYFIDAGFLIVFETDNLHENPLDEDYKTEHEEMYSAEGIKIKAIIAKKIAIKRD